jgi:uncharacterized protein YfaQ (DUF2300 family)
LNEKGGFAGWSQAGTPIWAMGEGSSKEMIDRHSDEIFKRLPQITGHDGPIVVVNFFKKYPIKRVLSLPEKKNVVSGQLHGDYLVEFKQGTKLVLRSSGKLILDNNLIHGTFPMEEYVARVIDREGSGQDPEAAKALAVLVRTYLLKEGSPLGNGFQIDDTSKKQRVSPSSPSKEALSAARFTKDLLYQGKTIHYTDKTWLRMKELSQAGHNFSVILKFLSPDAKLALRHNENFDQCQRLRLAESYLSHSLTRWRKILRKQTGFEDVPDVSVCHLRLTKAYSDLKNNRIYLNFDESSEARITLAHEYLHLGFKHHPLTKDEYFIEALAKRLTGVGHE